MTKKQITNATMPRDYSRRAYVKARAIEMRKARRTKRAAAILFSFA